MIRVVVDTNVYVSGLIKRNGPPGRVLAAQRGGQFDLVTSPALLAELEMVLRRPHILKLIHASVAEVLDFVDQLRVASIVVTPDIAVTVARDPDDDRVLEAAQAGQADFIVSGDRDLLDLREFVGVPILTPTGFLTLLAVE